MVRKKVEEEKVEETTMPAKVAIKTHPHQRLSQRKGMGTRNYTSATFPEESDFARSMHKPEHQPANPHPICTMQVASNS